MNRRRFVRTGLFSSVALATVTNLAEGATGKSATAPAASELDELTTSDLQAGMKSGRYTARSITRMYLDHIDEIDQVFGGDAFPYGIEPNRPTLNALVQYLHEQALIPAPVAVDDLFVPVHGES